MPRVPYATVNPANGGIFRGLKPPVSTSPWRDAINDMRHGAPRRLIGDALTRFAGTIPAEARVLEVGAGHYDHRGFFPGRELVRFDADPEQHPDIVGDAHQMPFDDASFDAVVAISVLEHVANPFRVTEEIARVLKPGARVFVWAPFFFAVHGYPGDVTRFTSEGLAGCFQQAGLYVEHLDASPYSGLFFTLSDLVHFVFARRHHRAWVRLANRVAFMAVRIGFPLDARFKLATMYAGSELIAGKP